MNLVDGGMVLVLLLVLGQDAGGMLRPSSGDRQGIVRGSSGAAQGIDLVNGCVFGHVWGDRRF